MRRSTRRNYIARANKLLVKPPFTLDMLRANGKCTEALETLY